MASKKTVHSLISHVQSDIFIEDELNPDIFFAELGQKFFFVAVIVGFSTAFTLRAARTCDIAVRNKHLEVLVRAIYADFAHITGNVIVVDEQRICRWRKRKRSDDTLAIWVAIHRQDTYKDFPVRLIHLGRRRSVSFDSVREIEDWEF